jgi:AraC-like DNA-binding protein
VLLLQNETNLVPYIIDRAYEKGMRTLFNPAPFTPALSELDYHKISWLVLNEIEAVGLGKGQTPAQSLQNIRTRYPNVAVVMTLGGDGCVYADAERTLTHPAFCVEVVDTTAAGDTFIGYFLGAIVQDKKAAVAIARASAAAALAVSKKGAAPSIPYAKEVTAALGCLKAISKATTRRAHLQGRIEEYLRANLSDANLEGLARELGYSKAYTGELVRELLGTTFSQLLQQMRCGAAAELLLEGEHSVEDVIAKVGYKNESFFRVLFKKRFGVSPNHYKKNGGGAV